MHGRSHTKTNKHNMEEATLEDATEAYTKYKRGEELGSGNLKVLVKFVVCWRITAQMAERDFHNTAAAKRICGSGLGGAHGSHIWRHLQL